MLNHQIMFHFLQISVMYRTAFYSSLVALASSIAAIRFRETSLGLTHKQRRKQSDATLFGSELGMMLSENALFLSFTVGMLTGVRIR